MTRFVHIDYPQEHPGVARAEAVFAAAGRLRQGFDGTRGIAALLLAAIVSASLIVADQLLDGGAGGGLLAAWMLLWVVAFAAMVLFATPTRRLAGAMVKGLDAWSSRMAQARSDERLWAAAQADPRVMSDLTAAMARNDVPAPRIAAAMRAPAAARRQSLRDIMAGWQADVEKARMDVARLDAELDQGALSVPPVTQTLLRADKTTALRDAAYTMGARRSYYF